MGLPLYNCSVTIRPASKCIELNVLLLLSLSLLLPEQEQSAINLKCECVYLCFITALENNNHSTERER